MGSTLVVGQEDFQGGLMPVVNINKKLPNKFKVNFKTESRFLMYKSIPETSREWLSNYVLTDMALMFARKIGINKGAAAGYVIRFRDGDIFHRLSQQFSLTQKFSSWRLSHRAATDQTFLEGELNVWRLRYRVAAELPLSGQSVDEKEFYMKINNEYLNIFNKDNYDLEVRLVPSLGYKISDSNKIELANNYRLSGFLNEGRGKHRFWLALQWFYSL